MPGDVLLVDEAGMLDQDTARALFAIADQLPAVGRGGVLLMRTGAHVKRS